MIGYYSAGVRNVYTRKGPPQTPEDLKGTKIRVMNNPIEAKIWSTIGTIPTPMNFGEVYQSLQTGVLDAAENGLSVIESNRHYEAAKTIILTEHQRSLSLLFFNERKFNSLPADQQKAMLEAGREASVIQRKRDTELNADAVERMKPKGATIRHPGPRPLPRLDRADPGRGRRHHEDDRRSDAGARPREISYARAAGPHRLESNCRAAGGHPAARFLLAFITIGVFILVVMRYVFSMSFLWGEELSLFAFIWSVFLGAAVGVRRRIHLGFDFFAELLPGAGADAQTLVIDLSHPGVALLLLIEGWSFSVLSVRRLSPALGISLFVPTLVIPISGALMARRRAARPRARRAAALAGTESLMDPLRCCSAA